MGDWKDKKPRAFRARFKVPSHDHAAKIPSFYCCAASHVQTRLSVINNNREPLGDWMNSNSLAIKTIRVPLISITNKRLYIASGGQADVDRSSTTQPQIIFDVRLTRNAPW